MNRWKIAAVFGWSLVGIVGLSGAVDRMEVRARRFVVEDSKGKAVVVSGTHEDAPYLYLLDTRNDRPRLWLSVDKQGVPDVTMYDGAGNEVLDVTGYADGPKVTYRVSGGKERTLP